jgi:small subunit ribosomal protein S8
MSITDPIADYLTIIRNAVRANHEEVKMPASQAKLEITKILKEEGYIDNFKYEEDNKQGIIRIMLKYSVHKESVIKGIKRISKPSRRLYCTCARIPMVQKGLGICVISTSKGLLTGAQAKRLKIGGEVLCYIW